MTDLTSIISTDIISAKEDIFWNELQGQVSLNSDSILLVITQPYHNSNEEIQLQKIIQACQIDLSKQSIIQCSSEIAWHKIKALINPKVVLLVGIPQHTLGISALFHPYYPNNFDERLWILAPSLQEMEIHPDTKKQLWQHGLKPVFIDKTAGGL